MDFVNELKWVNEEYYSYFTKYYYYYLFKHLFNVVLSDYMEIFL